MSSFDYTPFDSNAASFNQYSRKENKFLKQYIFHLKVSNEALVNVRKLYEVESLSDVDLRCLLVDSLKGANLGTPDENSIVIVEDLNITIKEVKKNKNLFSFRIETDSNEINNEWSSNHKIEGFVKKNVLHPIWELVLIDVSVD
jgi:hypothetical protein